jgi:preprotein translocase subunit SecD
VAFHQAKNALTSVILLGAVTCGCHTTQHPASRTTSTTKAPPATTQPVAPAVNIQPLSVRRVQKSQPTTPDKCPAANPNAAAAPTNVLTACDLAKTTLYTLGPEAMRLGLTHVDPPKSLTAGFYEVLLTLDPPSATAWASFTAANLHDHVALLRDDLVLEAPLIEYQVTSGQIALTTQTVQAADQLALLAGRPA